MLPICEGGTREPLTIANAWMVGKKPGNYSSEVAKGRR